MARPDLSYLKNILLTLVGIAAGVWCGASGMALAVFAAPLLLWLIGARSYRLGGSVLVITLSASLLSLLAYGQARELDWRAIAIVAVASVAGSLIGSLPQLMKLRSSRIAQGIFCAALVGIGVWMIRSHGMGVIGGFNSIRHTPAVEMLLIAGFVAGLVAALANISGILIVPALYALAAMPMQMAQGTSLAALAAVSILPAISSVSQQRYSPQAALWCGLGAALGGLCGSRIAVQITGADLSEIYGVGLIVAALVILSGTFSSTLVHARSSGDNASG